MKQIPAFMGWLLVIIAFGLYLFGIGDAIFISFNCLPKNPAVVLPEPLDLMVSSIAAILLTNLGAVLGISITDKTSALAAKTLPFRTTGISISPPMNSREQIQYAAVLIYIIGLISCFIAWGFAKFKTDPKMVISLITQQGKTLIGVISAYVAFILGVKY